MGKQANNSLAQKLTQLGYLPIYSEHVVTEKKERQPKSKPGDVQVKVAPPKLKPNLASQLASSIDQTKQHLSNQSNNNNPLTQAQQLMRIKEIEDSNKKKRPN